MINSANTRRSVGYRGFITPNVHPAENSNNVDDHFADVSKMAQGCGPFVSRLEFAQGAGKLVGAAGASAVALDSFKAGDGIGYLHSGNKRAYSLQVAIAAGGEADAFYNVIGCFYVNEFRADKGAGLERGAADAVLGCIGYQGYVKHSLYAFVMQR